MRKSILAGALIGLVSALVSSPAQAQDAGKWEIGGFGRYNHYDSKLPIHPVDSTWRNRYGAGGRLGYFFSKNWEVEVDGSYNESNLYFPGILVTAWANMPFHARLLYNAPLGGDNFKFIIGAGPGLTKYKYATEGTNFNASALVGLRLHLFWWIHARIDGTLDYEPSATTSATYQSALGTESRTTLGLQAGLSLIPGGGCDHAGDAVTVSPSSATLAPGDKRTFSGSAMICGKPRPVTYSATGGDVTQSGEYTAGGTEGSYNVTATEPKSGKMGTASVTVRKPAPPPPPPPAPTLSRVALSPKDAKYEMPGGVDYSVTGYYSDGTSKVLSTCSLSGTGNPSVSGSRLSWPAPGSYSVTANCESKSDNANVLVTRRPPVIIINGTHFAFNSPKMVFNKKWADSLRAAADSLKRHPELRVRLDGNADYVGSDPHNCWLSWERAKSVRTELIKRGVKANQIVSVAGYSATVPLPENEILQTWRDTKAKKKDKGNWWDRRVEVNFADTPAPGTACPEASKSSAGKKATAKPAGAKKAAAKPPAAAKKP